MGKKYYNINMPPVRSITVADDVIRFTDMEGVEKKLLASDIPKEYNTLQSVEDYLSKIFFPENQGGDKTQAVDPKDGKTYTTAKAYQVKVHVYSIKPLSISTMIADIDVVIPDNWWIPE